MKEKELMDFMQSLWNRGLLTKSPDELDYEWVIWDYKRINSGQCAKPKPPAPPEDRRLPEGGPVKPPRRFE